MKNFFCLEIKYTKYSRNFMDLKKDLRKVYFRKKNYLYNI